MEMLSRKYKNQLFLSLAFFFVFGFSVVSFSQQPSYIQFTNTNGLPSNTVYYVIQDSEGYFWFATDKGLSRFNGYDFSTFTTNDGTGDNEIFDLYEDSQKRIWLACSNGNLSYYKDGLFNNKLNNKLLSAINSRYTGLKVLEDNKRQIQFVTQKSNVCITQNAVIKQNFLGEEIAFSTMVKSSSNEVIALSYNRDSIFLNNLTTPKKAG
ncbi:MAG: hypothetical protein IT236_06820, partial [Bacteroidia bacterium]|nr:hypothetical protein [Bacteroidia bacterium]